MVFLGKIVVSVFCREFYSRLVYMFFVLFFWAKSALVLIFTLLECLIMRTVMVMTIYRNGDDNVMMRRRRHLGICGYCREANTPHFHQHWLPDDDVRGDDDDRDDKDDYGHH